VNTEADTGRPFDAVITVSSTFSDIAALGIRVDNNRLVGIEFLDPESVETKVKTRHLVTRGANKNNKPVTGYAKEVVNQLEHYFKDPGWRFTLNMGKDGTEFQQRVWKKLQDIPHNKKYTYGDVAKSLSSSPRAVGGACRSNPVPIVVPCHRVVAINGLGGFCGTKNKNSKKLQIKQWLLEHEKKDGIWR
jgi:methylated-DNA-[protein]-cysteine S-methyltransferase